MWRREKTISGQTQSRETQRARGGEREKDLRSRRKVAGSDIEREKMFNLAQ